MFPLSAEHGRGIDDLLDAVIAVVSKIKSVTTEATETTEEQHGDLSRSTRRVPHPSRSLRRVGAPTKSETPDSNQIPQEPTANDQQPLADVDPATKIAIIGHPNVGKSTLINRLTASDRSIVSPIPGTTRDAVDEVITRNGKEFRFIDTAGIRRKGKTHLVAEKLSVVMARKHLETADIALLIIDATEGVSALDAAIAGYAHDSGRSMIIIVNKWDLITGPNAEVSQKPRTRAARLQDSKRVGDRDAYEMRLRHELKFLSYAPVLFISAASGQGTEKIFHMLEKVAAERRKRITTGEMNRFLKRIDFDRASVPVRQRVKILYLTQAAVSPPTFVLFTDRQVKLHFSYQRFLENQIRHSFGFVGTPIWIKVRAR
jgi:GTP-binding protein